MALPKHILSKTTFMYGSQCQKRLWLHKKKPSLKDKLSAEQEQIFQQGTGVGLLAQSLFPNGIDASPPNPWSYQQSVADTAKFIRNGHQIIYEAAFQYNGVLCAVDILIKTAKGWIAYEIKGSLSLKTVHIDDAALQYYVLSNSELQLADFVIVHLNKDYIRQGDLDLKKLFYPVSVVQKILSIQESVADNVSTFQSLLQSNMVPDVVVGNQCFAPYPCDFLGHCHNGIFNIVEKEQEEKRTSFDYPVAFLELETCMNAVPQQDGHWPYKKNIIAFNFLLRTADGYETIVEKIALDGNIEDLDLCLALLQGLEAAAMVIVKDVNTVFKTLEGLKKILPDQTSRICSIQEKLGT